jgi:hypothetical protein
MKRQVFTVAGAVALLLVVVAAASRTQLFHESEPPVTPGLSRLLVDFTLYLFIAFEAAVGLLVIWALWPREEYGMPEIKRPPWWHLLIQYAGLALVFGIGVLLASRLRQRFLGGQAVQAGAGAGRPNPVTSGLGVPNTPPGFDWLAFGLVVLLLAVVALVSWQRLRRRRVRLREERHVQQALAEVVADALDDLRTDSDPRRAVIQAYARMERVLAVHQFPRRGHETPEEYLGRVLAELDIREAAIRRLTELYQFAKFSQHPVDEGMRADALEALADVRQDLLMPALDARGLGRPVAT